MWQTFVSSVNLRIGDYIILCVASGNVNLPNGLSIAVLNLVPRVSRARRDPGRVWSRASVTIENLKEGSSLNKEFVALSFVEFKARLIASRCDSAITCDVLQ